MWVARTDIVKRGFRPRTSELWRGTVPDAEQWAKMSSICLRLQGEMLEFGRVAAVSWQPEAVYDGTIDSLIHIYLHDPDSPFQNLRPKTKQGYESLFRTLSVTVGRKHVPSLTFRDFKRWHEGFAKPLKEDAHVRTARAHGLMTQVRGLMAFGKQLRLPGCKEAREVLADMEFRMPQKRTAFVTAAQAILVRQEAHRLGMPSIALAQALQFDLMLRQKDVLGETVPMDEPGLSDIAFGGRKWLYGLHWKEITEDLILTHRLSKSLRGRQAITDPTAGKTETFDLKAYPMVMEELAHITRRDGPLVIRETTGRPWDGKSFNRAWRKIATKVGIPKNVQNRDSRAGGITEALNAGAHPDMVRRHAGHSQLSTTMGYSRDSVASKAEVITLRVKDRSKTA